MNQPIGNMNILHNWNIVDIEKWMVFVLSFNQMNNDGNYYGHITKAAFCFVVLHKNTHAYTHIIYIYIVSK